jgi:hypothetical protein
MRGGHLKRGPPVRSGGAPTASTCSVDPTWASLSGTQTVNVTVSVATTARSFVALPGRILPRIDVSGLRTVPLLALALTLLALVARSGRRRLRGAATRKKLSLREVRNSTSEIVGGVQSADRFASGIGLRVGGAGRRRFADLS